VEFARLNGITQIFIARPAKGSWFKPSGWALVEDIVRLAQDMRVTIVAQHLRN
jgi:K+-sensing histidine kinase KdpD